MVVGNSVSKIANLPSVFLISSLRLSVGWLKQTVGNILRKTGQTTGLRFCFKYTLGYCQIHTIKIKSLIFNGKSNFAQLTHYTMNKKNRLRIILIPIMLTLSSAIMAMAWLGHLKYKEDLSFMTASLLAWLLVLPEYLLNVSAIRWGVGVYQPSEMAAMNLSSGIVFIALVSHFFLGEELTTQKYIGFGLMIVAMILIAESKPSESINIK